MGKHLKEERCVETVASGVDLLDRPDMVGVDVTLFDDPEKIPVRRPDHSPVSGRIVDEGRKERRLRFAARARR